MDLKELDFKELDFKELTFKELGVLGYLMGVPIYWAFPIAYWAFPIAYWAFSAMDWAFPRRLFEGVAHTIFFGVVPELGT